MLELIEQTCIAHKKLTSQSCVSPCTGYCQISCGNCSCCSTFAQVLQSNGASQFLHAANAVGLKGNLSSPASAFTILAPTDAALDAALAKLGMLNCLHALLLRLPNGPA